uniref:hypothetical protein n=1 Tax=Actinacidiphila alni TaxID=380248 RepID=UPI001FE9FC8D|nr:hypothetical protein [Actinacidiphila alni]
MRHALAVVLTLTACAVPAGSTSLLVVGESIADAPPHVLDRLGVRSVPVLPQRRSQCEPRGRPSSVGLATAVTSARRAPLRRRAWRRTGHGAARCRCSGGWGTSGSPTRRPRRVRRTLTDAQTCSSAWHGGATGAVFPRALVPGA